MSLIKSRIVWQGDGYYAPTPVMGPQLHNLNVQFQFVAPSLSEARAATAGTDEHPILIYEQDLVLFDEVKWSVGARLMPHVKTLGYWTLRDISSILTSLARVTTTQALCEWWQGEFGAQLDELVQCATCMPNPDLPAGRGHKCDCAACKAVAKLVEIRLGTFAWAR